MTPDQEILQDMGRVLGSLVQPDMEAIVFRGKVYDDYKEGMPSWIDEAGSETEFGENGTLPYQEIAQLLDLAEGLRDTPVFQASPFTHFTLKIDRDLDMQLETADVPKSQDWDTLHMRSLKDLDEESLDGFDVPLDIWKSACLENV